MPLSIKTAIVATLFLPFLASLYAFFFGGLFLRTASTVFSFSTLFSAISSGASVYRNGPISYSLGGWGAPLGIELSLDGISAVMLIFTALVGTCITIYAKDYFSHEGGKPATNYFTSYSGNFFYPLWFLAWGGLNALFLSADIFNIYVTLELMTFSAIAMITLDSSMKALTSAAKYLFVTLLGSVAYLLGVGMLYSAYSVLDIPSLEARIQPDDAIAFTASALIIAGMLIKSALFPMHFWLPAAHANAPSPVSAILSGLVITAPIYLLIRFWFSIFSPLYLSYTGQLLGILGSVAVFWGSTQALRQERLKMLLAYSTVAQIGYMFLLFPLANTVSPGQVFAWNAVILFAVSHGFAKAAAFMAAGSIILELGHDRISDFGGLARSSSMNVFVLALSGMNLMGMPPSGGFIAKWMLLKAAMLSGQWWYAVIILAGGLLTACYIFKVLEVCMQARELESISPSSILMRYSSLAIALVSLLLGLGATIPLNLLKRGQPLSIELFEGMAL